jgi:4-amino-4-deoxy-L-arabinose transferase-like glycosyltransferase
LLFNCIIIDSNEKEMVNPKFDKNQKLLILSMIFGIIYLFIAFNFELNIYDEAIGIYGAQRVLNGEIPYRDFWTIYAPGYYYILSVVLYLFGNCIVTERIFSILIMFLNSVIVYLITKKFTNNKYALIPYFLSIVWFGYSPFYGKAVPLAMLFGLIGFLFAIDFEKKSQLKVLFLAGLSTALATIFRHDFGFYFFVVITFYILIVSFSNSELILDRWKYLSKYFAIYLFGVLLVLLPVALFFVKEAGINEMYNLLIKIPSTIFPEYRALPFPMPFTIPSYFGEVSKVKGLLIRIETLIFYFPFLIYLLSLIKLFRWTNADSYKIFLSKYSDFIYLLILGIALLNQSYIRSDREHLLPSLLISFILFAKIIFENWNNRKVKIVFGVIIALLVIVPITDKINRTKKMLSSKATLCFNIPKAEGICDEKQWATEFEQTVNYLRRNVDESNKILVANYFHDKVLMNDLMIYYLSGRNSATRYHEFHPGITTRADVQKEIISELRKWNVDFIVQCPNTEFPEPNKSRVSSRVFLLDSFIDSNYIQINKFGGYKILFKKSKLIRVN